MYTLASSYIKTFSRTNVQLLYIYSTVIRVAVSYKNLNWELRYWGSSLLSTRHGGTALMRLKQEDPKFEFHVSLGYLVRPCLKKKKISGL
jgi:hypothetical protein